MYKSICYTCIVYLHSGLSAPLDGRCDSTTRSCIRHWCSSSRSLHSITPFLATRPFNAIRALALDWLIRALPSLVSGDGDGPHIAEWPRLVLEPTQRMTASKIGTQYQKLMRQLLACGRVSRASSSASPRPWARPPPSRPPQPEPKADCSCARVPWPSRPWPSPSCRPA